MPNYFYKSIISYNGKNYSGWQSQKNGKGIQDKLENYLFKIFKKKINIQGASRTDAGVHAYNQVIKFSAPVNYECERLRKIINSHLPNDIFFRKIEYSNENFCPCIEAKSKIYCYYISFKKQNFVYSPYVTYSIRKFDIDLFKRHLTNFIGTHDFLSFATINKDEIGHKNTVRTIYSCDVDILKNDIIQVRFTGNGFLRYMIRRIVGASMIASFRNYSEDYLKKILLEKNPKNTLLTAPPEGLILMNISYEENHKFENISLFDIF